jgi:hypothetical protein
VREVWKKSNQRGKIMKRGDTISLLRRKEHHSLRRFPVSAHLPSNKNEYGSEDVTMDRSNGLRQEPRDFGFLN